MCDNSQLHVNNYYRCRLDPTKISPPPGFHPSAISPTPQTGKLHTNYNHRHPRHRQHTNTDFQYRQHLNASLKSALTNKNDFSTFHSQNEKKHTKDLRTGLRAPPGFGYIAQHPRYKQNATSATTYEKYDKSKTMCTSSTLYGHAANSLLATIDFDVKNIRE